MPFASRRHALSWSLAAVLAVGALSSTPLRAQEPGQIRVQPASGAAASHVAPRRSHALAGAGQGGVIQVALRQSRHETAPLPSRRELTPAPSQLTQLHSEVAFVQDLSSSTVLYDQNSDEARPIASISKLMTALVVAEANLPMDEILSISDEDVDRVRHSRSRLAVGTELSRADMLHLALMSSENRAAHALSRHYPGGMPAFIRAMNDKARALGMRRTHFVEPTGLSEHNVSTPRDLVKLLRAAAEQPLIQRYSTDDSYQVTVGKGRSLQYNNTNRLVKNSQWDIQLSKTGFINEAGQCLVMVTRIGGRDLAIVLLNATGSYSRIGDAVRLRKFVENETNLAML
ncbi:D-alanyl-D-alanine endopeptidase [Pusillimonas caeni]|uniref:D-alanyl-D-alanine endopeptidase n=1 Tax=Pusillimonas caeni TaxID=1348472 RepID=UPI000E59C055|nr:D-alanyl-D-alanine endopeptidase [Pusillimonas caeni]TFL10039.1 D-alanyl-D-alanine endopeptidase [Pusillimonas caeni]